MSFDGGLVLDADGRLGLLRRGGSIIGYLSLHLSQCRNLLVIFLVSRGEGLVFWFG